MVIVGGGIAGLTAATVLGRARRRVAVIDAGHPRDSPADHVHGFPSRDGVAPEYLLELCRSDLERYDVDLVAGQATQLKPDRSVKLADGRVLRGRHMVIATGLRDVLPEFSGAWERWGKDLLQCPYCHGWEVADRPLVVLGSSPSSVQQAFLVRSFSSEVTLTVQEGLDLTAEDVRSLTAMGVEIVEGTAANLLLHDDSLTGVALADGRQLDCRAVFCEPGASVDPLPGMPTALRRV